ncbi:50S ribosomal protein L29 [Candidatus Methylacidiphilum infernorum]|uniref:Large ribosomal subunit protein uL29 n=1 Tax=Candidatus Methylacidiphilum infernorum TaxID=511746 RepID=A0ABX7PUD9_9BACT|nr:50S ribosomal protein L29 [Candidatus Methylacidiphilum infernorum]QSR86517.1 50S ribosomal protein L29 [Candidatus Methylacidiphilum infernorum]
MKRKDQLVELRALGLKELSAKEKECREELFRLRMQQSTAALEKPSRIKELKKMIARIQTLYREKAKGEDSR